jgi:competence transcription factor ComK
MISHCSINFYAKQLKLEIWKESLKKIAQKSIFLNFKMADQIKMASATTVFFFWPSHSRFSTDGPTEVPWCLFQQVHFKIDRQMT